MAIITLKMEAYVKMIYLTMVTFTKLCLKDFVSEFHCKIRETGMVPQYRPMGDSGVASANGKSDLQMLHDLRFQYPKNLLCGYLNINSLRNKIHDLRLIIHDVPIDYVVISETKLGNSFPNGQLKINNYEIRDRDKRGGGLIEFVRKGLVCKRKGLICKRLVIHRSNLLRGNHLKQKLGHL